VPEFVEIHHPGLGRTSRVAAKSAPGWIARGWRRGPLPAAKTAARPAGPETATAVDPTVPEGDITTTPTKEG
jgi:hypothetical protein